MTFPLKAVRPADNQARLVVGSPAWLLRRCWSCWRVVWSSKTYSWVFNPSSYARVPSMSSFWVEFRPNGVLKHLPSYAQLLGSGTSFFLLSRSSFGTALTCILGKRLLKIRNQYHSVCVLHACKRQDPGEQHNNKVHIHKQYTGGGMGKVGPCPTCMYSNHMFLSRDSQLWTYRGLCTRQPDT
jgi:hypothetical protein